MKRLLALLAAFAAITGCPGILTAQDFGNNTTELREVMAAELIKPAIPDIQVGDNPTPGPVPRPIYLVYRYYSCSPWYPFYIRDVFTDVVERNQFAVEIDTAGALNPGDNVDGQIVTDINHPAYGLYCITVRICVPWNAWATNLARRWYIRWAWGAPYWCWHDHWWYYWQRPCVNLTLNAAQEVPPNSSPATGSATVCIDQNGVLRYTLSYSGLTSGASAAHFHAPAPPGQNAAPIITIPVPTGQTSATVSGTVTLSVSQLQHFANGLVYINVHSSNFGGGEIRGQVPVIQPGPAIWCPWGPAWWPYTRWTRIGTLWGLTVCHPYCYPWNPFYVPRPFCLYGLRYYYTPFGNVRAPVVDPADPNAVPLNDALSLSALSARPWSIYNSIILGKIIQRPPFHYWPYTPYCQRWYWFRCLPFSLYRYNPPVVHFATWVNPTPNPVNTHFPDQPNPGLPGTMCTLTTRSVVLQPGDLNGDGFVNAADQAAFRQQNSTQGIDSFFDVFVAELE